MTHEQLAQMLEIMRRSDILLSKEEAQGLLDLPGQLRLPKFDLLP